MLTRTITLRLSLVLIFLICALNSAQSQGFFTDKQKPSVVTQAIHTSFLNNKLFLYPEKYPNGGIFIFKVSEEDRTIRLLTHIVFNQQNSKIYTERFRELAKQVAERLRGVQAPEEWTEDILVAPLAILDSADGYSTPTVFRVNPEAKKLMEFFTEKEGFRLLPIVRGQQTAGY